MKSKVLTGLLVVAVWVCLMNVVTLLAAPPAVPANTLNALGLNAPYFLSENGSSVGVNEVISALRAGSLITLDTGQGANELYDMNQNVLTTSDVTFDNITASDGVTLGGVRRTTWPAGGGGLAAFYSGEYIVYVNVTGYYTQDVRNGTVIYSGAVFDTVLNNTLALGGKTVITPGNYVKSLNQTLLMAVENSELQINAGVNITIDAGSTTYNIFTIGATKVKIHGDGLIEGLKNQQVNEQTLYYVRDGYSFFTGDTYVHNLKGKYLVDDGGSNSNNNQWNNRYYTEAAKKITPSTNKMLAESTQRLIVNFTSGLADPVINEVYGDFTYITSDVITRPSSLYCVPNLAESATEPVRVQILYAAGQVWNDTNALIWMKFTGTIDPTFDIILEIWDKADSQALQCKLSDIGTELNNEGIDRWYPMMFSFKANTTDTAPRINMSDVDDIRIRFMSAVDTWNVTLDNFMLLPNYLSYPNGAFGYATDGPYDNQFNWLIPLADQYGYKVCFATSYDIPGEDPGNADVYLANLTTAYKAGHIIGVYTRAYDNQATPEPLSDAEILDFALLQKQWLIDHGLVEDFYYAQMNRHLLDVHVIDLLDDYFHVLKGAYPDGLSLWREPWLHPNIVTTTPAAALTRVQRAHTDGLVTMIFNHLNLEPDTYANLKTMFQYAYNNNMASYTWRDMYYNECIVGNR